MAVKPDAALLGKWNRRHEKAQGIGTVPAVLSENLHLLPEAGGDALDLACGRGAGALQLSRCGMSTHAWDISDVAINRLEMFAREIGIKVQTQCRDVITRPPEPASFDLILVSYFLDRSLVPAIVEGLRPGGLLFYETFCRDAVSACGPSNPEYRLKDNELLRLFAQLRVRFYREEGRLGNTARGKRDIAMLVAEKRR